MRGPLGQTERNPHNGKRQNPQQNSAADAAGHQDRNKNQADGCEKDLWIGNLAKANKCSRVRDDYFCVAQADECDEESDAAGGSVLEAIQNAVDDLLAHFREREDQTENSGKKNNAECGLPRDATPQHDRVSKVSVKGHAWG